MYRLLIVDPDPEVCESIQHLLDWRRYGFYSIMTASSFPEAVSRAVDWQPHVALVDVHLGEHPGYTLAAQIRATGMHTVFCMISDYGSTEDMRRSMHAGARDYLLKPLKAQELQDFIERTIQHEFWGAPPEQDAAAPGYDPVLRLQYTKLSKVTNKILMLIRSGYRQSLSLTGIAERLNMSSKYIGRIFQRDTGMKFTDYLTAYRMMEARRLIINTQEKISVISDMVGYRQLNNFYTHFKNYHGYSPSALRGYYAPIPDESVF